MKTFSDPIIEYSSTRMDKVIFQVLKIYSKAKEGEELTCLKYMCCVNRDVLSLKCAMGF